MVSLQYIGNPITGQNLFLPRNSGNSSLVQNFAMGGKQNFTGSILLGFNWRGIVAMMSLNHADY